MNFRTPLLLASACLAGFFGGTLSTPTSTFAAQMDVARAARFELVNAAGVPLATLDEGADHGAHLRFFSRSGTATLDIHSAPNGLPNIEMSGLDRKRRLVLGLDEEDKPTLGMGDENWEGRVLIGYMPPDSKPRGNWDHWGILLRGAKIEAENAGLFVVRQDDGKYDAFIRIQGRRIR